VSTQHTSLTPERWAGYPPGRQLMMIANEMNRASKMSRGLAFFLLKHTPEQEPHSA
jgi:hypothetical protein